MPHKAVKRLLTTNRKWQSAPVTEM